MGEREFLLFNFVGAPPSVIADCGLFYMSSFLGRGFVQYAPERKASRGRLAGFNQAAAGGGRLPPREAVGLACSLSS